MEASRPLIHAPLWRSPRFAAQHQELAIPAFATAPTTPALCLCNPLSRRDPAGGVFRWLDLDVLVALAGWQRRHPGSELTLTHLDLLAAMGYDLRQRLPYAGTLAALQRLAQTRILLLRSPAEEGPGREEPGPLLHRADVITTAGSRILRLSVNPWWTNSLEGWWTPDDERIYSAIARADRCRGLVRRLYLLLASVRGPTGAIALPLSVLTDRLADRHGPGRDTPLRFRNPCDPRSQLGAALGLLHRLGILSCATAAGPREELVVQGQLHRPDLLPLRPGRHRKSPLVAIDPQRWQPAPDSMNEELVVLSMDEPEE